MTKKTNPLFQTVFFIAVVLNLFSCSQNNEQNSKTEKTADSLIAPQQIVLASLPDTSKPKQFFLEKTSPANTLKIPAVGGSGNYSIQTKSGIKIIKLEGPTIHSLINSSTQQPIAADAQGAAFFTNYTTDNGLALDGISSSIMDKT